MARGAGGCQTRRAKSDQVREYEFSGGTGAQDRHAEVVCQSAPRTREKRDGLNHISRGVLLSLAATPPLPRGAARRGRTLEVAGDGRVR